MITRRQLLACGLGECAIKYRLRTKRLCPVQRGVYRVGPLVSAQLREFAAVLACGPGAVVSHRSAAVLLELLPAPGGTAAVDVSAGPRCRRHRPGVRLHRCEPPWPGDVVTVAGIPVTCAARTLVDLAGSVSTRELEQALARALRLGLVDGKQLASLVERCPRRRSIRALARLVDQPQSPPLTRSEAEERLLALVRKARLPGPESNVVVGGYEVDFLWRRERLVVEVDGFAYHSSARQFERDRERDARLAAAGWQVLRVTWHQIAREPEAMLVRLGQTLVRHHASGAAAPAGSPSRRRLNGSLRCRRGEPMG